MPQQAQYSETTFASINRSRDPAKLDRGEALLIQNLQPDSGDLVTRPGFKGQFTTPLPGPVYIASEFRVAGGSTQIVFASGTKLYRTVTGSATYTDITPAGVTINAAGIYGVRFGKYLYLCDGVNQLMTVTDTGAAATVVSLIAPTRTLTAALTSTTQDATNNAALWNGIPAPSSTANLIQNSGFENDGHGTFDSASGTWKFNAYAAANAYWGVVTGDPLAYTTAHDNNFTPFDGTQSLLLNDPDDTLAQYIPASALPTVDMTAYGLGVRKCRTYAFSVQAHQADRSGESTGVFRFSARDASGNALCADVIIVIDNLPNQTDNGAWTEPLYPVNFGSILDGIDPAGIYVSASGGSQNPDTQNSLYIDAFQLYAIPDRFSITQAGANSLAVQSSLQPALATATGYQWVRHGYSTPVDLSKSDDIAVAITLPAGTVNADDNPPRFRFGYTTTGGTVVYWTNAATYSADGAYLEVDTSTVKGQGPGGSDPRAACTGFFIQLLDDLATYEGSEIFQFGPVTAAGNLSVIQGVGREYLYLFQEDSFVSLTDQVFSSGSPITAPVTTSPTQAKVTLTLPASTGANAPYFENAVGTVNRISIYRAGGVLDATVYRLLAYFDPTADQSDPNGYWTWNHTTRVFTDNTPDGVLQAGADYYQLYRDTFPAGIQHIAVNQNRLHATAGAGYYQSWLIDGEGVGERGLYTSLTLDPTDPQAAIKGFFDPLTSSSSDPDNAQALLPHGTTVSVYREREISLVQGTDPRNVKVTDFLRDAGIGAVAPRAVCLVGNDIWHRAASGILAYGIRPLEGNRAERVSFRVDALIAPDIFNNGGVASTAGFVSPAAAALSFSLYHSGRLYHGCPRAGSSVNDQVVVWDSRAPAQGNQGGWFQWTLPVFMQAAGVGFTSGVSMSSLVDSDTAYFGGGDGQLYLLSGTFDQATPTSTPVPIAFTLQSRLYGRGEGERGLTTKIPSMLYVDVQPGENMTLTQTVQSPDTPTTLAANWTQPYNLVVNAMRQIQNRVASRARGKTLQVVLSGAVVTQFRLREYLLEVSEGDVR